MVTAKGNRKPPQQEENDADDTLNSRMTVEKGVVDELLLVCGVIGTTTNGDEIVPVTDCLNWLQDLQRALRRDDDTFRPISLLICKWKVVEQKLLPLVMSCRYDTALVLTIVKILVILTKPLNEITKKHGRAVIDVRNKKNDPLAIKEDILKRGNAISQSEMLMEYKRLITHHPSHSLGKNTRKEAGGLLSVFVSLLAEPLSKVGSSRSNADHLTIELVLHLLRNLLSAEPLLKGSGTSERSCQLHQELVCLFESELVLEILFVIAENMESREDENYNLLMMELLHHLLRNQDPTAVARTAKTKSPSESVGDQGNVTTNDVAVGLRTHLLKEKQRFKAEVSSRHSQFSGTLVVNRPDGKRKYIPASFLSQPTSAPLAKKRRNRKREPFVGSGRSRTSHTSLFKEESPTTVCAQRTIHNFCDRFLQDCYGPLVKSIKNEFRRDSVRLEENDKVVFFRIVWFFSQWWRMSGENRKLQTETGSAIGHLIFTMDVFTFNLALTSIDHFTTHKKYPQLAQAVAIYTEMMHLLYQLYVSRDSTENMMALGLMDRLFFGSEPQDRLPFVLSSWVPGTTRREFLCDVVEIAHITLKLMELVSQGQGPDQGRVRKRKQGEKKGDAIANMKASAAEFDVTSYVIRKLVSNQTVVIYTHLLGQYSVNAAHVNHRIIAFMLRLSKIRIASNIDNEGDGAPANKLAMKTVTLEPMLFNIQTILVLNQILNDSSIRNDKSYSSLLTFTTRLMRQFAESARANSLLFVECLFRHPAPHRFCEFVTNSYVNEELRMIAERELLLEEQRKLEDSFEDFEGDEANPANEEDPSEERQLHQNNGVVRRIGDGVECPHGGEVNNENRPQTAKVKTTIENPQLSDDEGEYEF